jgi:hypothetical protein
MLGVIVSKNDGILQSGDDFPGSQAPIRSRPSIVQYVILALVLVAIGLFIAVIWLNWSILEYMYRTKAGLDWFSINFYGGLTFTIAGLLALFFVNPLPRRSDLFEAFNALMGLQYRQTSYGGYGGQIPQRRIRPMYIRPSTLLWGFWQLFKWTALFAIFTVSNGFPGFGNLPMEIDMALKGYGSWNLVPRIAELPLNPASSTGIINLVPTMEIQYQIVVYAIQVLLIVIGLRFFLKFVRDVVIRAGDKWLRNIFITLSAIALSVLLGVPYWAMNVTIPYTWGAIATVLATFVALAVVFQLRSKKETVPLAQRRRTGVIIAAIVILGILSVNLGAVAYYNLNFNNNYINYLWTPQVSKQIAVSSWAAGTNNITQSNIVNVPSGNATTTLSLIRNWDTNSSRTQSLNQLGVNYLQLNTPEIVFVHGQEYWVATTTFSYPNPNDWRAVHLVYTHSSKIIVMNTHTGEFVPVTQAFDIPTQPLMYYGEDNFTRGFANDVYVHVAQAPPEIDNVSYAGASDYTLCGAQRSLWFLEQGQFGYAFSPPQNCIQMLHDREVFQRVGNVLITGLAEDSSTYLVTDGTNVYFAIQIYIDYPLHSGFTNVPTTPIQNYLRFFGVVLVNIANGQMQGYTVGQSDDFLTSFYKQYYPSWGSVPSWLQSQLRYPEQLLGNQAFLGQLDADFIDHIGSSLSDVSNYLSGSLFYTRPPSTEVLYIPFVIGNNVSFSAVQLVEYPGSQGKNLAGLYVVYGGQQLGQMYLYQGNVTASIPLLGPSAALSDFSTDPATKTQVTLTGAIAGNILLYPVLGHLYYFIPAYIRQSVGTGVVEKNPFVDVIDAENSSAPVTLVLTNSSEIYNYGFHIGTVFSNASIRTQNIDNLFTSRGVSLSNGTVSNANIIDKVGTTTYQTTEENATASTFINNFINSYVLNKTVTGGAIAFNSVFYWVPSAGTVNFGFVVSSQGVTRLYYVSVIVGTT